MSMSFQQLDDDTLIHILGFLPVTSIITLRKTCRRLAVISRLRFVWQTACIDQILSEGFPFPDRLLASADASELERLVIRALHLGLFWLAPSSISSPRSLDFQAGTGTGVSDVRFLSGHGGQYVLTVYKGIWSKISCWDVGEPVFSTRPESRPRKVADWCPRNTIFFGFVTNSDPDSEAVVAVAVQNQGDTHSIEILSIVGLQAEETPSFLSICSIASTFRPIALKGDLIAFSDDASETVIMNWRESTFARLKSSQRPVDERFQYNRCLQVVFAYKSVLVVRARSVELFPEPDLRPARGDYMTYQPIGVHTFGWIDGVAVNTQSGPRVGIDGRVELPSHEPLSIVLRPESDDPWASDVHKLEQFVLLPNPAFNADAHQDKSRANADNNNMDTDVVTDTAASAPTPYLFPPVRAEHTSPTVRGFLRCRDIALGPRGTVLWIQPRAARAAHLTALDVHASPTQVSDALDPDACHSPLYDRAAELPRSPGADTDREALCAAVFEGPLQRRHGRGAPSCRARTLWVQTREGSNWTALDYDEQTGRVVLGANDGRVTMLDLV